MAMATKHRVFVLLSDGDLNEGSTWEAVMFAGHHGLSNLTAIVDYNRIQCTARSEHVLDLGRLAEKWEAFGWETWDVQGHDHFYLETALNRGSNKPKCVIAHTIKGRGVSFMENNVSWHFKSPSDEELEKALEELR
jgi:transketolase